jgi:putative FmdB family regulatory protein
MRCLYTCKDCGSEFEVEGSFDAVINSNISCPGCKSANIKKKSMFSIVFKKSNNKK